MKSHRLAFCLLLLTFVLWSGLGFTSHAESITGPEIRLIFTVTIKDLTSGEIYDGNDDTEVYFLEPWHTYEVIYACSNATPDTSASGVYANLALPTKIDNRGTSYITGTLRATNTQPGIIFSQAAVSSEVTLYTVLSEESSKDAIKALETDEGFSLYTLENYDDGYYHHSSTDISYIFRTVPKWSLNPTTLQCWLKYAPYESTAILGGLILLIFIITRIQKSHLASHYESSFRWLEREKNRLSDRVDALEEELVIAQCQVSSPAASNRTMENTRKHAHNTGPVIYDLKAEPNSDGKAAENQSVTPLSDEKSHTND